MADDAAKRLARVQRAYMKAKAAGDADAAEALANEAQRLKLDTSLDKSARIREAEAAAREEYNPTKGQGFGTNLAQGYGRGSASVLRALGAGGLLEKFGFPSAEEAQQLDKPLLDTGGGITGNALANIAPAIPVAMATPVTATAAGTSALATGARVLPGLVRARTLAAPTSLAGRAANVVAPQALAGAATGAAFTEGDLGDRALGAGLGATFGAAGTALPPLWATTKALGGGLVEPLRAAGRERIVGRLLDRFSENPGQLAGLSSDPTVTGARLSTQEAARDPGLERLSRVIQNLEPKTTGRVRARAEENNRARIRSLEELAGLGGKREFFEADRAAATGPLLKLSDRLGFNVDAMTPDDLEFMSRLSQRIPSDVVTKAKNMAKVSGSDLDPSPEGSWKGFQYLKGALDDRIEKELLGNPKSTYAPELVGLKNELLGAVDQFNPAYQQWRQVYEQMSRPINQMDIGQRLLDTTTSSVNNMAGDAPLQVGAYTYALKNADRLTSQATGRAQPLADVLDPSQLGVVEGIRSELETLSNLGRWANGPGSQTARLLASENLARRIAGPMGLDDGFLNSTVADSLMNLTRLPYQWGGAEGRLQALAGDALLDPASASSFVSKARAYDAPKPSTRKGRAAKRATGAAAGTASAALVDE